MKRYGIDLECGRCEGEIEHVTEAKPIHGREVRGICRCMSCGTEWVLLVRLVASVDRIQDQTTRTFRDTPGKATRRHGTKGLYDKGCKCGPCLEVGRAYYRDRALKQAEVVA